MSESQSFVLLDVLSPESAANGRIKPREPPREVRLFRAGANPTRKGVFTFDEEAAKSVQERASEWGVDLSIDYAHAMLSGASAEDPSKSGKSAGWFRPEIRNGELWASDIRWTEAAHDAVSKGEWRYFSPVFQHTKSGQVTELLNLALTNMPATHRAPALVALDSLVSDSIREKEVLMDKVLIAALGLPETASDVECVQRATMNAALATSLSEITGKSGREALALVAQWRAAAERVESLAADVAKLRTEALAAEIESAVKDGRLAPAQREWATKLGAADPETLRAFLSTAPKIVAMDRPTEPGKRVESSPTALDASDSYIVAQLGIAPEAYLKSKGTVVRTVVADKDESK